MPDPEDNVNKQQTIFCFFLIQSNLSTHNSKHFSQISQYSEHFVLRLPVSAVFDYESRLTQDLSFKQRKKRQSLVA